MITKCVECGGKVVAGPQIVERAVAGHTFRGEVPGGKCENCGEGYYERSGLAAFEREIALRLAEAGEMGAEAVKWIRKQGGVAGKEFAELLDVRAETVSRWERGTRPIDRASYTVLVGLLLEGEATRSTVRELLERAKHPKKLARTVTVQPRSVRRVGDGSAEVLTASQAAREGKAYQVHRK